LLKQKVAPKVAIILGYFIFSKNHTEPPKVAQLAKKLPNLVTLMLNVVMLGVVTLSVMVPKNLPSRQGDQIGRFFANWATLGGSL
jgi:hypothetical protein